MVNIIPNGEEEKLLKEFTGNINDLARPERYLHKIISIPRYSERVKFIEFISKFPASMTIVKEDLNILKSCIDFVKNSKTIKTIFIICLAIANHLNNTSVMGFCLESFNAVLTLN